MEENQRVREREDAATSASDSSSVRNPFYDNIKHRWAKGEFSSLTVQDLAKDAVESFSIATDQGADVMRRLANAGTSGEYAQNMFRDISKIFGTPIGSPGMDWIEIPVKGNRRCPHPVFWPHIFFKSVATNRGDIWLNRIRGLDGAAEQFWGSIRHSDFVRNRPFLQQDQLFQ